MKNVNPFLKQLHAVFGTILVSVSAGMMFGYSAILLPQLQQDDSSIKISFELGSWIASTVPLLMSAGCLFIIPLLDRFGRRNTLILVCLPIFLGWILISSAPNLIILLIGRGIKGFGNGMFGSSFSSYVGEVAEPKYRGFFFAIVILALSTGVEFVHMLGTFLTWRKTAAIASILPLSAALVMVYVPESPYWFISKKRRAAAEAAFKWLRGDTPAMRQELDHAWTRQEIVDQDHIYSPGGIRKILEPSFYKPFIIISAAFFQSQFAGTYAVIFYSIDILNRITGAEINKYLLMDGIDGLRLLTVFIASILMQTMRRRVHIITSGLGTTTAAIILATYIHGCRVNNNWEDNPWIAISLFVAFILMSSYGIFVLPFCLSGELYPLRHKSLGNSLNTCFNYIMLFVSVKIAPTMFVKFGMDGTFIFYSIMCLIGTVTLTFMLPETKGRTLTDIEEEFCQKPENSELDQL